MALDQKHQNALKFLFYGSFITILIFIFFYITVQSLSDFQTISPFDSRLLSFIEVYRTPFLNQFMLFVTYMASWPSIVVAFSLLGICLVLLRQWHYLVTFTISLFLGETFVFFIKNLAERSRPPFSQALTFESSYSFPSAHTFIAFSFFGLLTYFFFHTIKGKFKKIFILVFGIALIMLIGFSRIYLGAHWPSDVIASFLAGIIWVFTLIIFNEISQHYPSHSKHSILPKRYIKIIGLFFCFIYELFLIVHFFVNPIENPIPAKPSHINSNFDITSQIFKSLPNYTQDINGKKIDNINLIIIGQPDELEIFLKKIGLTLAIKNKPIAFWNQEANDVTFQKNSDIFVPFWQTKIESEFNPIWISDTPLDTNTKNKLIKLGATIKNGIYLISL